MKVHSLLYVLSFSLLLMNGLLAQKTNQLDAGIIINATEFNGTTTLDSIRTVHIPGLTDSLGLRRIDSINLFESALVVGLITNELELPEIALDFSIRIKCKIRARLKDFRLISDSVYLSVNYNKAAGTNYKAKDFYQLDHAIWAEIKVDSVFCSIPFAQLIHEYFMLSANIQGSASPKIIESQKPTNLSIQLSHNKSDLKFKWDGVPWASSYDVEWTFKDAWTLEPELADYRMNSTRINTSQLFYEIPLIFDRGNIWFRVRPIGKKTNGETYIGDWVEKLNPFQISELLTMERSSKPWQHIANFAEHGLRKDIVSFMDGSSRQRQLQTRLSTEGNPILITETIYDYQGRAAIETLPAALKNKENSTTTFPRPRTGGPTIGGVSGTIDSRYLPTDFDLGSTGGGATTSHSYDWDQLYEFLEHKPKLTYVPGFNKNEFGNPYTWEDFDLDPSADSCNNSTNTNPFSSESGAGKYYSPNNDFTGFHTEYIPDAKGFPFLQTEFTPDNTGRISRSGKAGAELKLGSGHEVRYFYSTPSQKELTRIFGENVGDAKHYFKTLMQDENGQLFVSYANPKGQIIATALTGAKPDNLEAIESEPPFTDITDVIHQSNQLSVSGDQSTATHHFFVDQNNTEIILDYTIDRAKLEKSFECIPSISSCYDCPKRLTIMLKNDCGEIIFHRDTILGFQTDPDVDACDIRSNYMILSNQRMILNKGTYSLEKILSVIDDVKHAAVLDYITKDTSCFNPFFTPSAGCVTAASCELCDYEEVTIRGFKIWKRLPTSASGCSRTCGGRSAPFDVKLYETILADVSPGGQYGVMTADSIKQWPVSIFNITNYLRKNDILTATRDSFNYQKPIFNYRNPDGSEAWVNVTLLDEGSFISDHARNVDGQIFVRPQHILDLTFLSSVWQNSWSESLVAYHPEYAYFEWNSRQLNSINHDKQIAATANYDEAIHQHYINSSETIDLSTANQDPYFRALGDAQKMDVIDQYNNCANFDETRNVSIYQIVKKNIFCNAPMYDLPENKELLWNCIQTAAPISTAETNRKNFAWTLYKNTYLSIKSKIIDKHRTSALTADPILAGRLTNHSIQDASFGCPGYTSDPADSLKKYLKYRTRNVLHPDCMNVEGGIPTFSEFGPGNVADIKSKIQLDIYQSCNSLCPKAFDFLQLINALVVDTFPSRNKFSASGTKLVDLPPLVLPASLIGAFANKNSPQYYWNTTEDISRRQLTVRITDNTNREQASLRFTKNRSVPWDSLIYFNCFKRNRDAGSYNLKGFDENYDTVAIVMEVLSGFELWNCDAEMNALNFNKRIGQRKPIIRFPCCTNLTPTIKITPPDCSQFSRMQDIVHLRRLKNERADFLMDSLYRAYNTVCMNPATEHLTLTQNKYIYHYTLFYYDQSGNLIKTVPPKAVQIDDSGRNPVHNNNLSTRYKYNSLNAKISRTTPDGGTSKWCYDLVGRVILSQDAAQASSSRDANYLIYDSKGRIIESGVVANYPELENCFDQSAISYSRYKTSLLRLIKKEITVSVYDSIYLSEIGTEFSTSMQKNLRNRISSVLYTEEGSASKTNYKTAMHFSYDIAGNLKELVNDFKGLQNASGLSAELSNAHRFKRIKYEFDLITRNLKEIAYQQGYPDQFFHWYEYDADNRLIAAQTGRSRFEPEPYRDRDASYKYYLHGPVARSEIGKENIQGIDLIYTINGWIKNINNKKDYDPGQDGIENGFLKDALCYELNYFDGDYKAARADMGISTSSVPVRNLFTGNISGVNMYNRGFGDQHQDHYRYDQLDRLVQSRRDGGNQYAMNISYDKNGNIKTLQRYDGSANMFDNFSYVYNDATDNKLLRINDPLGQLLRTGNNRDLAPHAGGSNNYSYDAKGRLLTDVAEGNLSLSWYANDKLKQMRNDSATSTFSYDPLGRRIYKHTASGQGEYTVRDFKGNIIAQYKAHNGQIILNDIPVYAMSRIGVNRMDTLLNNVVNLKRWNQYRGGKIYELKNQIGDVNVLVSDRRVPDETKFLADIRSATEYYPFGMVMPGRDSSVMNYRFGFQGMEQDDNHKGNGNSYTTEFRQYDPRVGRWLSVDPMEEKFPMLNPYTAFSNNPINKIDPLGNDDMDPSEIVDGMNDLAGATLAIETFERSENVYNGQTRHVLRYSIAGGRNEIYAMTAGGPTPRGTRDPIAGLPGYDVPGRETLVENNRVLTQYNNLVRERNLIVLSLAQSVSDFIVENHEALNIHLTAEQLSSLQNISHTLGGINATISILEANEAGFDIIDGAADLAALSPQDLDRRLHAASRIFDGVISIISSVPIIGDLIPQLLTDDFLENTGRALFRNALQANSIIDSERRTIPNCRWNLHPDGIWTCRPGTTIPRD